MIDELLKPNITRMDILKHAIPPQALHTVHIAVYRNHAFEMMERMLQVFLNYSGLQANFYYSSYDDSFHFSTLNESIDLNIIWIDFSHYQDIEWFKDRVGVLKKHSKCPILIYYTGAENVNVHLENVVCVSSNTIERELGSDFLDLEKLEYSGTRLSSKALIRIAQQLGFKYIPSFFISPIKAIMVDMDNTLYEGVLGEEGAEAVIPNIAFQKQLKSLKNKGALLGLVSKNNYEDAYKLFTGRKDFVLHWEDFPFHAISWQPKDASIRDAAERFNIAVSDMLFVDDNWGEISRVQQMNVHTLVADKDLSYKFNLYPLLERYTQTKEDILRASDIKSNSERERLKNALSSEAYFKQLGMELTYNLDEADTFGRAIQLLNKTNQFIFSFKRYRLEDLTESQHVLTVKLRDKLSDSGIISVVVASSQNNALMIHEAVISCRALGREIEDSLLDTAFQFLSQKLHTSQHLIIDFKIGPRNLPAKTWLERYAGKILQQDEIISMGIKILPKNPFVKLTMI